MTAKNRRLVWLDMEMTGLDPEHDRILEVAVVVTDNDLNLVAEGPIAVVKQSDELLAGMDQWNQSTHGRSGLIDKVKASSLDETQAENLILDFLKLHVAAGSSPLCGNTVSQDRRFMFRYMPRLESFFHYRTIDVSTLKELAKRWRPDVYKGFSKHGRHEALADIYESIDEMRYYREHFLVTEATESQAADILPGDNEQ